MSLPAFRKYFACGILWGQAGSWLAKASWLQTRGLVCGGAAQQ